MFKLNPILAGLLRALQPLYFQHDMSIANDTGSAVRADINNALNAIATLQSGATAPSTTYAYQLWADTTTSTLKQRNAANTSWLKRSNLAESFVLSRAANTILGEADMGKVINATAGFTQTYTAAATLADGWWVVYKNNSSANVTHDPNASEQIDGATTLIQAPGESCLIYCNGTAFFTVGLNKINSLTADATPDGTADYVATYDASAGALAKVLLHNLFKTINGLTEDTTPDAAADYVATYDASAAGGKKVLLKNLGALTLAAEQATTAGTAVDFTGIPSGVRWISVMLESISGNGTSIFRLQLGDSGGVETTGYDSRCSSASGNLTSTAGFDLFQSAVAAANNYSGLVILSLKDGTDNTWNVLWVFSRNDGAGSFGTGTKALSAVLDRVRLTTVNGTDTFDAGSVSINYGY